MMSEVSSFAILAEYRPVRQLGAICNNSGKSRTKVISEFDVQSGYRDEVQYLCEDGDTVCSELLGGEIAEIYGCTLETIAYTRNRVADTDIYTLNMFNICLN